jgi:hypothetical protein
MLVVAGVTLCLIASACSGTGSPPPDTGGTALPISTRLGDLPSVLQGTPSTTATKLYVSPTAFRVGAPHAWEGHADVTVQDTYLDLSAPAFRTFSPDHPVQVIRYARWGWMAMASCTFEGFTNWKPAAKPAGWVDVDLSWWSTSPGCGPNGLDKSTGAAPPTDTKLADLSVMPEGTALNRATGLYISPWAISPDASGPSWTEGDESYLNLSAPASRTRSAQFSVKVVHYRDSGWVAIGDCNQRIRLRDPAEAKPAGWTYLYAYWVLPNGTICSN